MFNEEYQAVCNAGAGKSKFLRENPVGYIVSSLMAGLFIAFGSFVAFTLGQAVAAGANRGMQAANMLSTILGTTQAANEEATQLAVDRQTLANKYAQQLKQDTADALQYSNEMGNTIGSMAHQLYNDQIQQLTAQLAYNQGINTDAAGYAANKYTANANLAGNNASAGAGVYNNNQSAIAQLQAAIESANAQRYAADKGQYQNLEYSGGYTVHNG